MYPERVRIADSKDEEEIMSLCRALHDENGIFSLNEDKVRSTLRIAFERNGGVLGVIGKRTKIEAMIYMRVSSFWYSDDPQWEELFGYVKPEYRKATSNVSDLACFAKWCSDNAHFPLLIGVMSNWRTQGKVRLYRREFGEPIGAFFLYKPNGAVGAN